MEDGELLARAKNIMIRMVSEKIPMARGWPVSKEFKVWIDSLSDDAFKDYLDRLGTLRPSSSSEKKPNEQGAVIRAESYPLDQIEVRDRLDKIGGEATAYFALGLWRSIQEENLVRELGINKSDPPE
jgi:hypothetical protein